MELLLDKVNEEEEEEKVEISYSVLKFFFLMSWST